MTIRIIKILLVICYLLIPLKGENISGPLFEFLLVALKIDYWPIVVGSLLIWASILILILNIERKILISDKYLTPLLLTIMTTPVIMELDSILTENHWSSATSFKLTTGLYLTLAIITLFLTIRRKSTATNSQLAPPGQEAASRKRRLF
jgi:hypothetical protein